jgi:ankyrin repeat protein
LLVEEGKFDLYKKIIFNGLESTPFLLSLETNTDLGICEYVIDELRCDVNELFYINVIKTINNTGIDEDFDTEDMDQANILEFRRFIRNNRKGLKKELKKAAHLPVISALLNPNIKILEKVLSSGVDLDKVTKYTSLPLLHIAAKLVSRTECLDLIKGYGCDIQERCKFGLTALHYTAFFNGSIPVFNWLLDNGIDINAVCYDDVTAFSIADDYNPHEEVKKWFREHGAILSA